MSIQDPGQYGPVIAELLQQERLAPLGPGTPNRIVENQLHALSIERAFAHATVSDRQMASACLAGLWLYHDFLDESHTISQDIDTTTGSYWHGIMHRREPDSSNAAYWFRCVGEHPVFEELAREAQRLGMQLRSERWNPFDFIDHCEEHRGANTQQEMLLRRIQHTEWQLLFAYGYARSVEP
jgi:hypothetical protein